MSCKILLPECTDGNQTRSPSDSVSVDGSSSFPQSDALPESPSVEAENHYDYTMSPNAYPSPTLSRLANAIRNQSQSQQTGTPAPSQPPFSPLQTIGTLQRWDERTGNVAPIEIGINCIVDKGFFQSDGEWTCYRRNYFSSTCSYALDIGEPGVRFQYIQPGSHQPLRVYGFAMKISAEDPEDDRYIIELVQTTKRGPPSKPKPVRLWPESHLRHQEQTPTEHTFERLQFRLSTANNGGILQQYFRLVVVLLADVGEQQNGAGFIKITERRSAKLVVRGRSPGHHQEDRKDIIGNASNSMGSYVQNLLNKYNIDDITETRIRQDFQEECKIRLLPQLQPLERNVVDTDPGSGGSSHVESASEETSEEEDEDAWSLWMQDKKHRVIDAVMKSFCAWLDSKLASIRSAAASQNAEGNPGGAFSSCSGQLVTESNHTGGAQGVGHRRKCKLKRKKTDADEDEDHGKRPRSNSKFDEVKPDDEPRRCWQDFKSENLRDIHLQNDPPCDRRENDTILDGFTKDQEKQLRSRKKSETNVTAEGKWREMYQILFPDDDPATIPQPYHETVNVESSAPGLNTPAHFAAFARREYPRFVRRELEVLFESEFQDVEERVRPRVQDIVLNLQPRLIALYERSALSARGDGEWAGPSPPDKSVSDLRGEREPEEAQPVELPPVPSPNPPPNTAFAEGEVSTSWVSDNSSEPTAFEVDIDWSFLPQDMFIYPTVEAIPLMGISK
ncbi:hypothetical protein FDECE_14447 [Fusarium decemcellulare]|nr:hypothetical protein FDECE_14447 [Fusarium decemcellulare]